MEVYWQISSPSGYHRSCVCLMVNQYFVTHVTAAFLSAVLPLCCRSGRHRPVSALLCVPVGGSWSGPRHWAGKLHGPVPPEDQHHPRLSRGHTGGTCLLARRGRNFFVCVCLCPWPEFCRATGLIILVSSVRCAIHVCTNGVFPAKWTHWNLNISLFDKILTHLIRRIYWFSRFYLLYYVPL